MATMPTHTEFVSHVRVLNRVFAMNVAMIQPRNGYNQYYFAFDSEAELPRPRLGRGRMLEAVALTSRGQFLSSPTF